MTKPHSTAKSDPADEQPGRVDQARDAASRYLTDAGDRVSAAAHRAAEGVGANPLGILVGGLAVGAVVGALLPRSEKEKELLAPLGGRLGAAAKQAFAAAKEAGQSELSEAGLTREGAQDQFKTLLGHVSKALTNAGAAAATGAKQGIMASESTQA